MSRFVAIELMAREFWVYGWRGGAEFEMAELHMELNHV
jgi:hypothetical protein